MHNMLTTGDLRVATDPTSPQRIFIRRIQSRFGLSREVAATVVQLAGLGPKEAR